MQMFFRNDPLMLNLNHVRAKEWTNWLLQIHPRPVFSYFLYFFMMLDLSISIFSETVFRFCQQMKEIFKKMSWAVKKRGLILNTYVRWEFCCKKAYNFLLCFFFFLEGKPRKGVTYPSTLEYSSSKSTAVKPGK